MNLTTLVLSFTVRGKIKLHFSHYLAVAESQTGFILRRFRYILFIYEKHNLSRLSIYQSGNEF